MGTQPDCVKSFLPVEWIGGSGPFVWGSGREYIDFTSGIFVTNLGHRNPAIDLAICNQTHQLLHAYNYETPIRRKYVNALCPRTRFECVALFCEGAVAVEAAMRVIWAHQYGRLLHTPGQFMHGKTFRSRLRELMCSSLEEGEMPIKRPSGILLESYRGWDAHFWDKKWIQDLRVWCTENDALLCMDEIQSGFGRTGEFWCYEHYGIEPDLVVFGKAAGNGVPLSGILGSKRLLDLPGDLSATHSGHPLGCAAGLAVLREFDRSNLVNEAERKGAIFHRRLREIWPKVNGKGMVAALLTDSTEEANSIVTRAFERGLLLVQTGKPSVKIGPPLIIPDQVLNQGLNILEEVLKWQTLQL